MKLAFILDPLDSIKPYKDSSFAMMREAAARGHMLYFMEQQDMVLQLGRVLGHARKLTLTGDEDDWYRAGEIEVMPLERFDVVLMRKDHIEALSGITSISPARYQSSSST